MLVERTNSPMRCEFSGTTGSSRKNGRYGSSSGATRRALARLNRPWKSTATSRSSPSTSRAAATRRTTASSSATDATELIRPDAFIFTAVSPDSTAAAMWSRTSAGSSPPTQPYTRIRSRTGPPSSWCTGAPKCLPAMSHSAWSSPATALARIGPPR